MLKFVCKSICMNNSLLNQVYKVINTGNCFSCNKDLPNKHNHEIYFTSDVLECDCGFKLITYSRTLTLTILNMKFVLEFDYNYNHKALEQIVGYYDSKKLFTIVKVEDTFSYTGDDYIDNMVADLAADEDITLEKLRNFSYKLNKMNIFS